MARTFEITTPTKQVALDKTSRKCTVAFTIKNSSTNREKCIVKIVPLGSSQKEWFFLEEDSTFMIEANQVKSISPIVTIGADVKAGQYQFRLDAYSEKNPDDDYTEGQAVTVVVPQAQPEDEKKKEIPWWIIIVGCIVILLITGVVVFLIVFSKVKVPSVINQSYKNAVVLLQGKNLSSSVAEGEKFSDTAQWNVEKQNPKAGTSVKKKSIVILTVNAPVAVPNVTNQSFMNARTILAQLQLTATVADGQKPTDTLQWMIVKQEPLSGVQVEKNSSIVLTIAPSPPTPPISEDCNAFDPGSVRVERFLLGWRITTGFSSLINFSEKLDEAQKAVRIMQFYRMNSQCFVGRPNPPMQYYLSNGTAPTGPFPGEDAIPFNNANLEVKNFGTWKIVDGSHWMLDFGQSEQNAQTALRIIRKYGFTFICFVGRPNPPMMYFRR
ncbi:MAG: PASTA domain-containing protein [Chitinivibrionales bacterium]|nr:PASTA domain-containing protein [Chitinivibrionales bacterium]